MATTRQDIQRWFEEGVSQGDKWMIVVVDTFDHEDYPAYAKTDDEFWTKHERYNGQNMQRIMETYDLSADMEEQLSERRTHRKPAR
jgi:hypothetical protein